MSFGKPVDPREPFDTSLRIRDLENHLLQASVDQLRVVYDTLKKVFEDKKFDKESEISERLSSIESNIEKLNNRVKDVELAHQKAMKDLYDSMKNLVQHSLTQVMEAQALESQTQMERKFDRLEAKIANLDCYHK